MLTKVAAKAISITLALSFSTAAQAAEMLVNPREHSFNIHLYNSPDLSPTLVISESVGAFYSIPFESSSGGFIFARLYYGDSVYIISCEGYRLGFFWVYAYIPDLKEYGYIASEFLEDNFNCIC